MLNIVSEVSDLQTLRKTLVGKTIGFVATMGYLHAGHLALCEQSIKENDMTIVSIFVNPTQFNNQNDLVNYPRDLNHDIDLLNTLAVDYLFLPSSNEIYHDQYEVKVSETTLSQDLEGEYRPGHFDGVLTVVLKLLNLVQPTKAYFGEKDYQQLLLLKKMATALFLPTEIVGVETKRLKDKLPLSSRNARLSPEQRDKATTFSELLHDKHLNCEEIIQKLMAHGFRIDYIAEKWQRRLGAVWIDEVRLIDNFRTE